VKKNSSGNTGINGQKTIRHTTLWSYDITTGILLLAAANTNYNQCCQLVYIFFQSAWYVNFWFGIYEKFGRPIYSVDFQRV